MKKIIKNYIEKYLFNLLLKLKQFNTFPIFIKIFPKSTYKILLELMRNGYLDTASIIIKTYVPKVHEEHIVRRINSMIHIKQNKLIIPSFKKKLPKEKRILFAVHNSLPYDKAGYAIRTHSVATELQKNNISVTVCTRAGYPWDLQKHKHLDNSIKENIIDNIKYLRIEDKNKNFKKGSDFEYIKTYAKELVRKAKLHNSTILHANSNYLNAHAVIIAANELKIPSIYEIRGLWHITRLTLDKNYKYNGMFAYEEQMVKLAALSSDKVITISSALKDLLLSWGVQEKNITIIRNTVDTTFFTNKEKSISLIKKYKIKNKFIIGFIGSITAYEGLDYLINSVNELIQEKKEIILIIVGDGKQKEKLEGLSKSENIIFTGSIAHNKVKEYYSIFDLCVYPRNNYEVTRYVPPLKPLEAMAMKKAVIVSDVAPLLEIIKDGMTGLVCKSDDIEDLKKKIELLYDNNDLREELAHNGYKWVKENRSLDLIVKVYINLYNSLEKNIL